MLPVAAQAATYTVAAGAPPKAKMPAGFAQGLYDSDGYYPGSKKPLKIHVGDTVKFVGGFHTATFLGKASFSSLFLIQPDTTGGVYPAMNDAAGVPFYFGGQPKFVYGPSLVPMGGKTVSNKTTTHNSGALFLAGNKGYALKFTKAGTYRYVCLIHTQMKGSITVAPASAEVPTPAEAAKQGLEEANADVDEAIYAHLDRPSTVADPKNAVVEVGAGNKRFSLFAFYPQALSVKAGTTVTFKMGGPNEVHNVGFGPFAVQMDFLRLTDFFPQGPTDPNQLSPAFIYGTDPAVGGVYTYTGNTMHGNGLFATPVMDLDARSPLPSEVKVNVPTPGVYTLICQIHPNMIAMLDVHA
jgi:plastocyanin